MGAESCLWYGVSVRLHLYIGALVAALGLLACGGHSECASDDDCGAGSRCLPSGGVIFPTTICVSNDGNVVPTADAGPDVRADAAPDSDQPDNVCSGETPACGNRCGEVAFLDNCGNERTLDCGGCGEFGTCDQGSDEPQCVCQDGFQLDETSSGCVDIDECAQEERCDQTGNVCVNEPGGFRCACDEPSGYFGSGGADCRMSPVVADETWYAADFGQQFSVDIGPAPESGYVVSVVSTEAVELVEGLGLTWIPVGSRQCTGPGDLGVEVWVAKGPTAGGTVTVHLSQSTEALVMVSRVSGVGLGISTVGSGVRQGNASDGNCDSEGEPGPSEETVETAHPASIIYGVVGGQFDPGDALWDDARVIDTQTFQTMTMTHFVVGPPVDLPEHEVSLQLQSTEFAYFMAEVRPAN